MRPLPEGTLAEPPGSKTPSQSTWEKYLELSAVPLPYAYKDLLPTLRIPEQLHKYPLLHNRLHAFLSREVRSREAAKVLNEVKCPRTLSDRLVNPDQLRDNGAFWREQVTEETIRNKRVEMVRYLVDVIERHDMVIWNPDKLRQETPVQDYGTIAGDTSFTVMPSRGFVSTAGNKDTTQRLLTLLRIMRKHHKITLPFEVWTFPGEIPTSSLEYAELTEELGATIHEAHGLAKDTRKWKNFHIKGLAIASSSFQEVIYLDSDNIPLRDPTHLFESKNYIQNGRAAFWPDLSKDHVDNAIWRIIGDQCDLNQWTFESGQIVIDKTKAGNDGLNLAALHLAAYMQSENDFWFHMCGGDKDTFRWAFRALDIPFAVSPMWAVPLGHRNWFENGGRFCGHTILQYDLDTAFGNDEPQPLFVHSNLLKHISGVHRGNAFTHLGVGRGMCTDLDIWTFDPVLPEEVEKSQKTAVHRLSDLPGRPFSNFENMFFDEGGRAGGW
ncbi:hypothetical protein QFC21_002190 [Naganishia friedmannii]|uniref:Uncharacterized protein n=1 Tax=Naganishia friedmannii TaxID=89922 RepID=A0ACC2VXB2_9TREE|nr:hypothetical protein QFC21_002190 [Naganishia friedmannii]